MKRYSESRHIVCVAFWRVLPIHKERKPSWFSLLSHWADSNRRPTHYECVALPTEPQWQSRSATRSQRPTTPWSLRRLVPPLLPKIKDFWKPYLLLFGNNLIACINKSGCKITAFFRNTQETIVFFARLELFLYFCH